MFAQCLFKVCSEFIQHYYERKNITDYRKKMSPHHSLGRPLCSDLVQSFHIYTRTILFRLFGLANHKNYSFSLFLRFWYITIDHNPISPPNPSTTNILSTLFFIASGNVGSNVDPIKTHNTKHSVPTNVTIHFLLTTCFFSCSA